MTSLKPVNRSLSSLATSFNLVGLTNEALQLNPQGADIGLVFHGFYCILIGDLVDLPARILGLLMAIGGLGWLTFLSPPLAKPSVPLQSVLRPPRRSIGDAVAPRNGRERSTMEGTGQRSAGFAIAARHAPLIQSLSEQSS
jgi:hypothetical protein